VTQSSRPGRFPLGLDQVQPAGRPAPLAAQTVLRPQRPLQDLANDAARGVKPSGLGLDSQPVRQRMVQRLRADGINHDAVLSAFASVERHLFVDTALATQAYEDTSLPIGLEQTISKPSVVARMLALAFEGEGARARGHLGRVLEIGTGCGYQTALLSRLSKSVVSIERLKGLYDRARENLVPWRGADIRLVHGDGRLGHAPWAPFDTIVSAAGGEDVPQLWLDQLAEGGRLIAPAAHALRGGQALCVVDRGAQGYSRSWLDAVNFVPLKSGRS